MMESPARQQQNSQPAQPAEEANRYTRESILRSEQMYGHGFQSPGSVAAVETFCQRLNMRDGMEILDIGSGLGGASFFFAERYNATVLGLDVAQAMIEISNERKLEKGLKNVEFQLGDISTATLSAGRFDLAWTRDCILYIPDKQQVWQQVFRALKPGGQLFITDFCRSRAEISAEFQTYLDQCHYHLQNIDQYADTLASVGFEVDVKEDVTDKFIDYLIGERERLLKNREQFLDQFGEEDFQYLDNRWQKKTRYCLQGHFRWGLFIAHKPE